MFALIAGNVRILVAVFSFAMNNEVSDKPL
jgi:hypothetical protein